LHTDDLKPIIDECNIDPSNFFIIYLAHHPYECINDQSRNNLDQVFNTIGGDLYIHGHKHKPKTRESFGFFGRKLVNFNKLQIGTLNTYNLKRGGRRSFTLLKLNKDRTNSVTVNKEYVYEIDDDQMITLKNP